jgi:hypothetical protein
MVAGRAMLPVTTMCVCVCLCVCVCVCVCVCAGEERGIVVGNAQEGLMEWVRTCTDVSRDGSKRLVCRMRSL